MDIKLALDYLSEVITFRRSALHTPRGTNNFSAGPQLKVLHSSRILDTLVRCSVHRVITLLLWSGPSGREQRRCRREVPEAIAPVRPAGGIWVVRHRVTRDTAARVRRQGASGRLDAVASLAKDNHMLSFAR